METSLDIVLARAKSGHRLTVAELNLVRDVLSKPQSLDLYTAIQIVGQAKIRAMLNEVRVFLRHGDDSGVSGESDMIRRISVQVVGNLGSDGDLEEVFQSTVDESPYVRMAGATALGDMGVRSVQSKPKVAEALLDRFRSEKDAFVIEAIYSSMRVLLGESPLEGTVELRSFDIDAQVLDRIEALSLRVGSK